MRNLCDSNPTMLHVTQISKDFGSTNAVADLDLSVEKGQICGLLGPNGAGKTTSIRIICGVLVPTSGTIEIEGIDLAKNPCLAKQILGYVPEGAPLPLEMLPSEFLEATAAMYDLGKKQKADAIATWAERCDIVTVLSKPIGTLSRGFRQRVALASALLHQPKLLVLDEPTAGLDPLQRSSFHDLLREVASNAAVLYSSHHLAEVESTCDTIAIINHGKRIAFHECSTAEESETQTVEVSSMEVATAIGAEDIKELESGWVRCTTQQPREKIVELVQVHGGTIRLLQPSKKSLEEMYLELINGISQE